VQKKNNEIWRLTLDIDIDGCLGEIEEVMVDSLSEGPASRTLEPLAFLAATSVCFHFRHEAHPSQ
jgi:hypothetical protein